RRDVLARATDHVLEPADDGVIAPLVLDEEVAGAEPVAKERGSIGLRFLVVALGNTGTPYDELANGALRHVASILVNDAALTEGRWQAAGTRAHHVGRFVGHRHCRANFGHAEAFARHHVEAPFKIAMNGFGMTVGGDTAERRLRVIVARGLAI